MKTIYVYSCKILTRNSKKVNRLVPFTFESEIDPSPCYWGSRTSDAYTMFRDVHPRTKVLSIRDLILVDTKKE